MSKIPKSEGTVVCNVSGPLIWPVSRKATFGLFVLKELDIELRYEPDKSIFVALKYRNGNEICATSCPVDFDPVGDEKRRFFKLAVAWKSDDLTIVAGGSIISGSNRVAHKTIMLKTNSEMAEKRVDTQEQPIELGRGLVGAVPEELEEAKRELERAARHVATILQSKNLIELSDSWKSYLDAIVKVSNKIVGGTKALTGSEQAAKSWTGQYLKHIRDSKHWSYLLHARNADTHTLKAILKSDPDRMEVSSSGATHIQSLIGTEEGFNITYSGDMPNIQIVPGKVFPVSVVDRNITYSPPEGAESLDQLAQGGLAFLELWLRDTAKKFG